MSGQFVEDAVGFALGRTLETLVGPFVAANFGSIGSGFTSAGMKLLAVLVFARWVKENEL